MSPGGLRVPFTLLCVDSDVQRDVIAVIERADGLCCALLALVVSVDLVVNVGREAMEAVASVLFGDEALDGERSRVLQIDDCIWEWSVTFGHHLTGYVAALVLVLVRKHGTVEDSYLRYAGGHQHCEYNDHQNASLHMVT